MRGAWALLRECGVRGGEERAGRALLREEDRPPAEAVGELAAPAARAGRGALARAVERVERWLPVPCERVEDADEGERSPRDRAEEEAPSAAGRVTGAAADGAARLCASAARWSACWFDGGPGSRRKKVLPMAPPSSSGPNGSYSRLRVRAERARSSPSAI